jgi:NADPH:quinone reductase
MSIRAVVTDPQTADRLVIASTPSPLPSPDEALVRVKAVSLNRGEVRGAMMTERAGSRPGWDLAGTVEAAAANGSGPPVGARVVGFLPSRAWAELVAVPTDALASLPDEVLFAQAATLPVAGLTALHALERGGSLLGRGVLITGASGGVGHLAIQLANLMGAKVAALIRRDEHWALIEDAGAQRIVVSETADAAAEFGPYHLILESVGGQVLAKVVTMLAQGGTCVTLGASAASHATFDIRRFYGTGGLSLYGFILFHELKREPARLGLARLAQLVAEERLRPHIEVEAPWTDIAKVARQLMERGFTGKAVLHIDQP